MFYSRGHQHGAHWHQVARMDYVGLPWACSDNSVNMLNVLTWMNIFNFR